jgi:hypothetical protein
MTLSRWPQWTPRRPGWGRPAQRVKVWRRQPQGAIEQLAMVVSGQRWAWTCTCTGIREFAPTQPLALAVACAHLRNRHG